MSPHAYFGYTAKGKDLVINSENAKVVRLIYDTFEQRKRVSAVAKYLERQGILSPHGNNKWHYSTVRTILTNEAYIGDIILQKTFTNDFLSKRKKNNGERKKWYVKNHHPAIITRYPEILKQVVRKFILFSIYYHFFLLSDFSKSHL